jgi:hypothetical protein
MEPSGSRGRPDHFSGVSQDHLPAGSRKALDAVPHLPSSAVEDRLSVASSRSGIGVHQRSSAVPCGDYRRQSPVRVGRWGHSKEDQEKRRFRVRD